MWRVCCREGARRDAARGSNEIVGGLDGRCRISRIAGPLFRPDGDQEVQPNRLNSNDGRNQIWLKIHMRPYLLSFQ